MGEALMDARLLMQPASGHMDRQTRLTCMVHPHCALQGADCSVASNQQLSYMPDMAPVVLQDAAAAGHGRGSWA